MPSMATAFPRAQALMSQTVERVNRIMAAAGCRHDVVEAREREGDTEAGEGGSREQKGLGSSHTTGACSSRADHVAVLEWYRSSVVPGSTGEMAARDSGGDDDAADSEDEKGLEEEILGSAGISKVITVDA